MLYQYDKCPVCDNLFQEGDDIVTCPHCGTPHHRACYAEAGRCANAALHHTDFAYKRKNADAAFENSSNDVNISEEKNQAEMPFPLSINNNQNSENSEDAQNQNSVNADLFRQAKQNFSKGAAFVFKKDEKLDDVYLSDVITAVGFNFPKFISKFRKNKTISWNWGAFFFGPYYLFFRKMFKQGAAFLVLDFIGRIIVSMLYATELNALYKAVMAIDRNSITSLQYMSQVFDIMKSTKAWVAYAVISAVMLVLHIVIAMICDKLYRVRTVNLIKNVDKKLADDEMLTVNPIMGFNGKSMSPQEMRNVFLAGRGGVSYTAPLMAFLIVNIAVQFISSL